MVTAAILAGGKSSRFVVDKALYQLVGKAMVLHVVEKLLRSNLFTHVVVIASHRNASALAELGLDVVVDMLSIGPLGALYIALKMFREVIVVPCDTPLIRTESLAKLYSQCLESYDICVPRWSCGYLEPLVAVYRSSTLSVFEECISIEDYSTRCVISRARTMFIPVEKVFESPEKELFNVNTLGDLKKLLDLYRDELAYTR